MANVSSSNGLEKRPKLRFPGFDEPWEICKAESLFRNITDKNHPDDTVLTIVQGKGTLPRDKSGRNIHYDDASLSNYKRVEKGDFIIHLRSFEGGLEMAHETGIVSPAYTILRCSKPHSSLFYEAYFHTDEFINHVLSKAVEGIRDGRQISYEAFKWLGIPYCTNAEQEKISGLFDAINRRIEKQEQIVNALKKYKRGLSDELFSKNGATDDWTAIPFSEAFELLQNNTFSRDEMSTENGIVYNIHYGDVLIKYGAVVDLSKVEVPYIKSDVSLPKFAQHSYLKDGDIVIADTAEDYTVGKAVEIAGITDEKALSGLHTIPCRPKLSFAPMYLGYFINSNRFRAQILPLIQGTKVSSISKSEIMKTSVVFPSYEMQSRIASMLYTMDLKIDICNACAQELIRTKEALMQRLFI